MVPADSVRARKLGNGLHLYRGRERELQVLRIVQTTLAIRGRIRCRQALRGGSRIRGGARSLRPMDVISLERSSLYERTRECAWTVLRDWCFRMGKTGQRAREGFEFPAIRLAGIDFRREKDLAWRILRSSPPSLRNVRPDQRCRRRLQLSIGGLPGFLVKRR